MPATLTQPYPPKPRLTTRTQTVGHAVSRLCQRLFSGIRATLFGRGISDELFDIILVLALAAGTLVMLQFFM